MFIKCNPNLIYCIDDEKEYKFLFELRNYTKNCSDICISYNSKKYIIDDNLCIDNCSMDKIYKYEYNNICYKNCPNNTILADDNYSCIIIDNHKEHIDYMDDKTFDKLKFIIIWVSMAVIIVIKVIIIFVIIKKIYLIKIIFNEKQEITEIYSSPNKNVGELISMYYKKKKVEKKCKYFLYNGENIASEENKKKKIKNYFSSNSNRKEVIILVKDFSDDLSTVLIQ